MVHVLYIYTHSIIVRCHICQCQCTQVLLRDTWDCHYLGFVHIQGAGLYTQRNLDVHIPGYMANISILTSDNCILLVQEPVIIFTAQTSVILKSKKHDTTVVYCRLCTVKCQHSNSDMATSVL